MKSSLRRLTSALLLVGVGALLYLSLPLIERWAANTPPADPSGLVESPLAQIQVEGVDAGTAHRDTAGNVVIANCLIALERRGSIAAELVQSGSVAGQLVETSGAYLQSGLGDQRKFSLVLQGRIGPTTARVWQVSDGRFVWTDLAWNGDQLPARRHVKRIDLRKVRQELKSAAKGVAAPAPGRAAAELISPGQWAGFGGLPMLVGALADKFDFGAPRQMSLRNEPVYAMIGHWKPNERQTLLAPKKRTGDEWAKAPPLPPRMPHHVLIAVGARDLFPRLVEYRSGDDALSATGLAEDTRFRQSTVPLLKVDYLKPRFDQRIDPQHFAYREPDGVNFQDVTARRLALVKRSSSADKITQAGDAATSGAQRR